MQVKAYRGRGFPGPVVTGGIIIFALIFSFVILAVDLSYAFIDPRIKAKYAGGGKR